MNIQVQSWTKEEIELLQSNIDRGLSTICELFRSRTPYRSREAIEKKRRKLLKAKKENIISIGNTGFCSTAHLSPEDHVKVFFDKEEDPKTFETTLVIPDAHTFPGQDLYRFTALGRYANIKRPNNIVFMGDFGNFDSLSGWDKGKEASHGKKYKEDVKACREALDLFVSELADDYCPRIVFLGGNHDEGRIEKYIEINPSLRGHMDINEDLRLEEYGFEYIPYKKFLEIQGTLFTHAVMTAANTPVSGKNIMGTIASLTAKSIVVGHHHKFETMSYYRHGATDTCQVLLCGLFCEDTPDYADGAANSYNRCICMLTHWAPGRFDVDQISLDRLKALYL